ncbi:MAG TPA: 50S ribosomal protein L30 [Thermoanaerobaculia bacterium]|nr:50S ribosomal protein L30 [Thermoanaerobaculia bacterium]
MSEPKAKTLRIRQIRSTISTKPGHAESVRGLGLRRIRDVVERPDDSAVRGVLAKVGYLLEVEEVER